MRVLLVEDDETTAAFLLKGLREVGHSIEHSRTGTDGLAIATAERFDALILDRMVPGLDGLSLLRMLRAGGNMTPVLLLSALGQTDHRVEGLRAGADDYLAKPFSFAELLARLEAILRRHAPQHDEVKVLKVRDLQLDLITRRASRGPRAIDLLPREYQILEYLMRNKGRVVTRTMLLEQVWDYRFDPQTNVTDVHISRLRKKINGADEDPLIETVRGAGYRLVE
ncbi:MAG: response regulator transcription factor [Pseudomonadota bacterium]